MQNLPLQTATLTNSAAFSTPITTFGSFIQWRDQAQTWASSTVSWNDLNNYINVTNL